MTAKVGLLTALGAGLLAACSAGGTPASGEEKRTAEAVGVLTIQPEALATRLAAGERIQLIDVRTPEEFAEGHIAGAINVPLDGFDPAALPDPQGAERVLYCRSDRRSGEAAEQLAEATGETAVHLDGGVVGWESAGESLATP